ncbi:hypothetical protein CAEBREN_13523 [Caenorhabditis brenneri]|uniref:DUF7154 domain-containing protein n=1 Tax=Caenorhabditis brenneri TaxID=135651 RepID=G0P674_CAEBE|nr:hypothetical protein CAEBREN_13523 [Caenorhabditis brenneri]
MVRKSTSLEYIRQCTNGHGNEGRYTLVDNTLWGTSVRNLFVAKKFAVSGKGNITVPFKVYNGDSGQQYVNFVLVFQDHKADGSLKALDYKVTDRFGNILLTGNNFAETKFTAYYSWFFAKDAVDYYFTVNYEYQSGRQETMEVRWFAANYIPPNFLPFNN